MREEFEAWITQSPYEQNVARNPDDETNWVWPGQYKVYEVELAWCAWQAAKEGQSSSTEPANGTEGKEG